jgi:hypothetical protein
MANKEKGSVPRSSPYSLLAIGHSLFAIRIRFI